MPFGDPLKNPDYHKMMEHIYSKWIKPTVESITVSGNSNQKLSCHRADKDVSPGEIISHVIENLLDSFIVIADLSDRNPNVFYELGVRHAVSNNTILIARSLDDIPFDLRQLRTILYSYDPPGLINLRDTLKETIQNILDSSEKIDNPVRRFIYNREAEKIITQKGPPGYNAAESILTEMADLRKSFSKEVTGLRDLIQTIAKQLPVISEESPDGSELKFLEGFWESSSTKSYYCIRLINGVLYSPYCYGGADYLTGVYYNFKHIDDGLFAQWRWLERDLSGYTTLKIVDNDTLLEGWWYSHDIPLELITDYTKLDQYLNRMYQTTWKRVKGKKKCPKWADLFFEQLKDGRFDLNNRSERKEVPRKNAK